MELSKYQTTVLLLSQKYFVTSTRTEDYILVIADDVSDIRSNLKSIGLNNFRVASYLDKDKKNTVIVTFVS